MVQHWVATDDEEEELAMAMAISASLASHRSPIIPPKPNASTTRPPVTNKQPPYSSTSAYGSPGVGYQTPINGYVSGNGPPRTTNFAPPARPNRPGASSTTGAPMGDSSSAAAARADHASQRAAQNLRNISTVNAQIQQSQNISNTSHDPKGVQPTPSNRYYTSPKVPVPPTHPTSSPNPPTHINPHAHLGSSTAYGNSSNNSGGPYNPYAGAPVRPLSNTRGGGGHGGANSNGISYSSNYINPNVGNSSNVGSGHRSGMNHHSFNNSTNPTNTIPSYGMPSSGNRTAGNPVLYGSSSASSSSASSPSASSLSPSANAAKGAGAATHNRFASPAPQRPGSVRNLIPDFAPRQPAPYSYVSPVHIRPSPQTPSSTFPPPSPPPSGSTYPASSGFAGSGRSSGSQPWMSRSGGGSNSGNGGNNNKNSTSVPGTHNNTNNGTNNAYNPPLSTKSNDPSFPPRSGSSALPLSTSTKPPASTTSSVPSAPSNVCAGCRLKLVPNVSYIVALNSNWHAECFRCGFCGEPIAVESSTFAIGKEDGKPYHVDCYKHKTHPTCDVCGQFIPEKAGGRIEFKENPFWKEKYCPFHDEGNTPCCCACQRLQKHGYEWIPLNDGRYLCLECLDTTIHSTEEAQPLYKELLAFYASLGMPLPASPPPPLILVDAPTLSEFSSKEGRREGGGAGKGGGGGYGTGVKGEGTAPVFHVRGLMVATLYKSIPTIVRYDRSGKVQSVSRALDQPTSVTCTVKSILVMYGLPRLLTGCILAHELMHAYLRMRNVYGLPQKTEEGMCQLMACIWLDQQHGKLGKDPKLQRLSSFLAFQIREDRSVIYGDGFREAYDAFQRMGLAALVKKVIETGKFI